MYAQVGEFRVSWIISTVPLTRFLRNTVFSRNQNAHTAGNRWTFLYIRYFLAPIMLQLELNHESLKLLNIYSLGEACDLDGIGASASQTCSNQPSYLWTSSGCGSHYSMPRTSFQRSEHLFFIPACASATNQSQYSAQWWEILFSVKLLQCSGCCKSTEQKCGKSHLCTSVDQVVLW